MYQELVTCDHEHLKFLSTLVLTVLYSCQISCPIRNKEHTWEGFWEKVGEGNMMMEQLRDGQKYLYVGRYYFYPSPNISLLDF